MTDEPNRQWEIVLGIVCIIVGLAVLVWGGN